MTTIWKKAERARKKLKRVIYKKPKKRISGNKKINTLYNKTFICENKNREIHNYSRNQK